MKQLKFIILILLSTAAISRGQDKPVPVSEDMFEPVFDYAPLGALDGWYFRAGNDTSWTKTDISMAGWQKLSPGELTAKYADKNGKVEGWFRLKIKLDKTLKEKGYNIGCVSYAPTDIYINGKWIGSFGFTGRHGHPYSELDAGALDPVIPFDAKNGEQFTLAVHLVDSLEPLAPRLLKSQTTDGSYLITLGRANTQNLMTIAYVAQIKMGAAAIAVCLALSLLYWLMVIKNRGEKVFRYIAIWMTLMSLLMFISLQQSQLQGISCLSNNIYSMAEIFGFTLVRVFTPVMIAAIFRRRLRTWIKIVLVAYVAYSLAASIFQWHQQLPTIISHLFLPGLVIYQVISSWKTLRGAQWSVVAGLAIFLLIVLTVGGLLLFNWHIPNVGTLFFLILAMILIFPLSLLVYVALRFNEMVHEVKQNADEIVRLSEEKKEEALNRQALLQQEVDRQTAEIRANQAQLIQSAKMASLGELTAGIAHEIQNPLNFVNNFSEVNREMIGELKTELKSGNLDEVLAIADDIEQNDQKIIHHGKRAEFIVKGMLEHSRAGTGERQSTNINVLADEFLKLSYHGVRAKDKDINVDLVTNFDATLPRINVMQQDIGRVLVNLYNNAFYAVGQKVKTAGPDYKPTVELATSMIDGQMIISVRDNGNGIPENIKDKIMQPFFTTKPTGEGTGLGLSLSYDIVVKGHGGSITVESTEGEGSAFVVRLPI